MKRSSLSVRVRPETERMLAYLRLRTGLRTSGVVRASIARYFKTVSARGGDARDILEASGFIASGSGPSDTSERSKQHLAAALARKHS